MDQRRFDFMQNREILIGLLALAFVLSLAWVFFVVAPGEWPVNGITEGLWWILLLFVFPAACAILLSQHHPQAPYATVLFGLLLLFLSFAAFSYRLQAFAELVVSALGVLLALALLYFSLPFFAPQKAKS